MMRDRTFPRCLAVLMAFVWIVSCTTMIEKRTQTIKVNTDPPGAKVWVGDETGQKVVGTSPTEVTRDYDVELTEFNSNWWFVTGGLALLGLIGGVICAAVRNNYIEPTGIAAIAIPSTVASALAFAIAEGSSSKDFSAQDIRVGASLYGYTTKQMDITIPGDQKEINFLLQPERATAPAVATAPAAQVEAPQPATGPGPRRQIVAVFDVHDATGRLKKNTLVQLTNYLGTVLAQTGSYSTIPREQLRARLFEKKKGSYKECYDERCQIELGKSVAAQKTLATTLIRVGNKCAVTANLFDLKTETAEKGASVETGCSPDELLSAMRQIAEQLAVK